MATLSPPGVGAAAADRLLTFEPLKVTWMWLNPSSVRQLPPLHACTAGEEQQKRGSGRCMGCGDTKRSVGAASLSMPRRGRSCRSARLPGQVPALRRGSRAPFASRGT